LPFPGKGIDNFLFSGQLPGEGKKYERGILNYGVEW
jgi:hypothetical protein